MPPMTDDAIREDLRDLGAHVVELADGELLSNVHILEALLARVSRLLAAAKLREAERREASRANEHASGGNGHRREVIY